MRRASRDARPPSAAAASGGTVAIASRERRRILGAYPLEPASTAQDRPVPKVRAPQTGPPVEVVDVKGPLSKHSWIISAAAPLPLRHILSHILGHLRTRSASGCRRRVRPRPRIRRSGPSSSVSTQSAPGGIRTPNLLIRSNSIGPTWAEAARPQTKPRQMFAQVTGVWTRQGGPGRGVTEPRSAQFWVTFWVRTCQHLVARGCGRHSPRSCGAGCPPAPQPRRSHQGGPRRRPPRISPSSDGAEAPGLPAGGWRAG